MLQLHKRQLHKNKAVALGWGGPDYQVSIPDTVREREK